MSTTIPATNLQLRSLLKPEGELELTLAERPMPQPDADEVLIRVEATPINPSDLGMLFGAADMAGARASGSAARPVLTASVSERGMKGMAGRIGMSVPCGNEGAGTVVAAGSSAAAQALVGRKVAAMGGSMYAHYRCVKLDQTLELPPGVSAAEGASCFINPLTALGFVETMNHEGHKAIVHTAAASNLGQMLLRICQKDGIELVNIVRKPEQAQLLRDAGARHVCCTASPTFTDELTDAIAATGATLAFDATGGGKLGGQILSCMEAAINRKATEYSRYGSTVLKQLYVYGSLDTSPTEFVRNFGSAWSIGGWLVFPYLQKLDPAVTRRLKQRVADELKTTFASHYAKEISLAQMLDPAEVAVYNRRATGTKFLVNPSRD